MTNRGYYEPAIHRSLQNCLSYLLLRATIPYCASHVNLQLGRMVQSTHHCNDKQASRFLLKSWPCPDASPAGLGDQFLHWFREWCSLAQRIVYIFFTEHGVSLWKSCSEQRLVCFLDLFGRWWCSVLCHPEDESLTLDLRRGRQASLIRPEKNKLPTLDASLNPLILFILLASLLTFAPLIPLGGAEGANASVTCVPDTDIDIDVDFVGT